MHFHLIHPGVTLADELQARDLSPAFVAAKLHVPSSQVQAIVEGDQPVTPDIALRLSRFLGTSAEFWMALQTNYDLELARRDLGAQIVAEVEIAA